jgi:glutamate-5-semialdehyde dehydrogenase
MDYKKEMDDIILKARKTAPLLSVMPTADKNKVLLAMADDLTAYAGSIREANELDIKNAVEKGLSEAFIDRLRLTDKRIDSMAGMFREVASLEDPIGKILDQKKRPNGLLIKKVRVPIGVIGIIFESRPNVTADCVSLCFKSGNVVVLRGGSDAINSNRAIYRVLRDAAKKAGAPEDSFLLVEDTSRELVEQMLASAGGIDLIMPRGGESLIKRVVEKSKVPVIKHYKGICHVYVDRTANIAMATDICVNAKTQRPGVCNAMETMLVHKDIAQAFLKKIYGELKDLGVEILGCDRTRRILGGDIKPADDGDYATEWLSLTLNVKIVDSLDEAVDHIEKFGSHHSDAIVTSDAAAGDRFVKRVDSSAVYVNASTRFTDGGEFGLGAEIGISTDKIHARGPMGLNELTSYKYVVSGTGQIRI